MRRGMEILSWFFPVWFILIPFYALELIPVWTGLVGIVYIAVLVAYDRCSSEERFQERP